jgi:hypothetical protein
MFEIAEQYGQRRASQKIRWVLRAAAAALAASLPMAAALAQEEPSAEETAAARALALEGIKLADAGRCEEAIERLARAERLRHAPVVLGRLGECQIARGRLVEGTETLRKMLREPLPSSPPEVVLAARERAQGVLDKTKNRIGALNIVVQGPDDTAQVSVMVDGQPMNAALLEVDRPTDPGDHLIEAVAPGFSTASSRVSVGVGSRQRVVIELVPDPHAALPEPASRAPASAALTAGAASSPSIIAAGNDERASGDAPSGNERALGQPDHTAAYVAWGAGGVAVAAGSVLGVMAFTRKGDLEEECPDNVCPATSRDRLESARGVGTAATVSFIVAGAAVGLGTVLYFTAEPSAGGEASAASLRARAWLGLGSVGLSGEF